MSNRPSAETLPGATVSDPAIVAATNIARRRTRKKANSVRNANSTQRNKTRRSTTGFSAIHHKSRW
jgi:hypothetical protein